jgi:hypothetical protein
MKMLELFREEMAIVAADRVRAAADRARAAKQMQTFIELKMYKEDNKTLQMNLSTLDPEVVEYFRDLQREILQRRRESRIYGTPSGGAGGAGGSSGDGASNA